MSLTLTGLDEIDADYITTDYLDANYINDISRVVVNYVANTTSDIQAQINDLSTNLTAKKCSKLLLFNLFNPPFREVIL